MQRPGDEDVDISPLREVTNLRWFDLSGVGVNATNISALRDSKIFTYLNLENVYAHLSALRDLRYLLHSTSQGPSH